jgi:hypothetical protein
MYSILAHDSCSVITDAGLVEWFWVESKGRGGEEILGEMRADKVRPRQPEVVSWRPHRLLPSAKSPSTPDAYILHADYSICHHLPQCSTVPNWERSLAAGTTFLQPVGVPPVASHTAT